MTSRLGARRHARARLLAGGVAVATLLCGTAQAVAADGPTPQGLWTWGYDGSGQLDNGGAGSTSTPGQAGGLPTLAAIGAGGNHSLAVGSDGSMWAWGDDTYGQLGDGTSGAGSGSPVRVSGLSGALQVTGGEGHSIALAADGTVWAWGFNAEGQVGDGTTTNRSVPVQVGGLSGVTAVAAGYNQGMALKSDGTVWTWGQGVCGELGNNTSQNSSVPVQVSGLSNVVAIAGGYQVAEAATADGTVWEWGGTCNATIPDSAVPVAVSGISGVVALGEATALKNDGTVWTLWTNSSNQPAQLPGLAGVKAISAQGGHGMAVEPDGSVWCWGFNEFGALGDGTTNDSSTPVQAGTLNDVTLVAAGGAHSMAVVGPPPPTPPSAPLNLTAQAGTSAGSIDLAWQAPASSGSSALSAYRIYRGTASGAETLLTSVGASSTTFVDTGLQGGQAYYYEVSAVNSVEGPLSNEASAVAPSPPPPPSAPSAPRNLAANTVSPGVIGLSWQAPSSAGYPAITGYRIYRGTVSGGETFLTQVSAGTLSYTDSGLALTNTRYYYRVSAVNGLESPLSNEACASPLAGALGCPGV